MKSTHRTSNFLASDKKSYSLYLLLVIIVKVIRKKEDNPKNSQVNSRKNQLLEHTKNNILSIKKLSCVKNLSLVNKSDV